MEDLGEIIEDRSFEHNRNDFEVIPPGNYLAIVTKAEIVITKAGTGKMLVTTHTILDLGYEGRILQFRFNVQNPSEVAQRIGRGQLTTLSRAVGLRDIPAESEQLLDKPHLIKIGLEKPSDAFNPETGEPYPQRNEIKDFKPAAGGMVKKKNEAIATIMDTEPVMVSDELPDFMK